MRQSETEDWAWLRVYIICIYAYTRSPYEALRLSFSVTNDSGHVYIDVYLLYLREIRSTVCDDSVCNAGPFLHSRDSIALLRVLFVNKPFLAFIYFMLSFIEKNFISHVLGLLFYHYYYYDFFSILVMFLFLQCFSAGAEIGQHKNDHSYQFMVNPMFFLAVLIDAIDLLTWLST